MKRLAMLVVTLLMVVGYTQFDWTRPDPPAPVDEPSPYTPIWLPAVVGTCDDLLLRQSDAALEDLWPHVDRMTIDGSGDYGRDDVVRLDDAHVDLAIQFWQGDRLFYEGMLLVDLYCG